MTLGESPREDWVRQKMHAPIATDGKEAVQASSHTLELKLTWCPFPTCLPISGCPAEHF